MPHLAPSRPSPSHFRAWLCQVPVSFDSIARIDMLDCVLLQMQSFDADEKLWVLASQVGPPLPGDHWPYA